jgi:hypothetical protein
MAQSIVPARAAARRASPTALLKRAFRLAVGGPVYTGARYTYQMWRRDRGAPFPLKTKLDAWRRGFLADSAVLFDFSRNDPRDYVSDWQLLYRCNRINPVNVFFRHKLMWRSFMLNMGYKQAETVALVTAQHILLDPFGQGRRYVSPADFERWVADDGGRFILKPEDGARGEGVFQLEARDGVVMCSRGRDAAVPFRRTQFGELAVVERQLVHHDFWRTLFPQSANTIRVLTLWTPGESAPFVARAVQRVGTVDTMPTDNWSGGGICAPIDLATARLGRARIHPLSPKRISDPFTHHPDTGAAIEGQVLPHWDRVRDTVLRAAASLPVNRYIGWDIFVDETGTPIIIEANGNTGLQMVQVETGLLTDPEIRRFYEKYGVV